MSKFWSPPQGCHSSFGETFRHVALMPDQGTCSTEEGSDKHGSQRFQKASYSKGVSRHVPGSEREREHSRGTWMVQSVK